MTDPPVNLRLVEGVELGHAWVQTLADARGIRVLFIKGPALHRHGLRAERTSADVDVLVDPAGFDNLCDAIQRAGWTARPASFISRRTTVHSATLLRDGWPCDVDVHKFYPGFLAAPADVFYQLWSRRVSMDFAHTTCDVADRVSGILILALHSLRSATIQARHVEELKQLVRVELTGAEREDLGRLALMTGSAATLETVLPRLGVSAEPPAAELASPELREWRERVASESYGAYFWLYELRRAPWSEKPTLVWRAFWPTDHDLVISRTEVKDEFWPKLAGRFARWVRGIRSVPSAVRAMTGRR